MNGHPSLVSTSLECLHEVVGARVAQVHVVSVFVAEIDHTYVQMLVGAESLGLGNGVSCSKGGLGNLVDVFEITDRKRSILEKVADTHVITLSVASMRGSRTGSPSAVRLRSPCPGT
jgi:hypothetical protein